MKLCALDYLDATDPIQAALDDAEAGDNIYLPGFRPNNAIYEAPSGGWKIEKSLTVQGDGQGVPGTHDGTTLSPGGSGAGFDVLVVDTSGGAIANVFIHALKIKNRVGHAAPDGNNGIRLAVGTQAVGRLMLQNIAVLNVGGSGYALSGVDPDTDPLGCLLMLGCTSAFCAGVGIALDSVRVGTVVRCSDGASGAGGISAVGSGVLFIVTATDDSATSSGPQFLIRNCRAVALDACWFEKFQAGAKVACTIEVSTGEVGGPVWVGGCNLGNEGDNKGLGTTGFKVDASMHAPVTIWPNHHTRAAKLIDVRIGGVGVVVWSQWNNAQQTPSLLIGTIDFATAPGGGDIRSPSINRLPAVQTGYAGLTLPSLSADPSSGQDGMLFYRTSGTPVFRVRVAGAWKSISTTPVT